MPSAEFFTELAAFQRRVRSLVAADPVGATMFDSVLAGQLVTPEPGRAPLLVVVVEQGDVAVAGLRITDHPMIVLLRPGIADPAGVLAELTAAVVASRMPVSGFSGRRTTVELLARQWSAAVDATPEQRMGLRYHRLGTLVPPVGVPGTARLASIQDPADVDLLAAWWFAFEHETGANAHTAAAPDPDSVLRPAARGHVVILWFDNGHPVAAAGHSAVRDGLSRIAPVFTPPEFRRRRYASAVTAAAVRSAQSAGANQVTLFTDADYVPANEVYRLLGFEVVAEFAEFDIPGAGIG